MNRSFSLLFAAFATVHAFAQFSATITITDGGNGLPLANAIVLINGDQQTTDVLGQAVFTGLVDGTYDYSVSATCYTAGNGSVTVAGADGASALALDALTTNNLFFYIGSPFALIGATVSLTDGADYNVSFVTWDTFGGEMVGDVPFGEYTYTISKPCYETITGTVTVGCNNGDGIAVVAEPAEANNVFFFVGSMMAITGATVEFTNGAGYDTSFVTWDTFGGEMIGDVPFGAYDYTVTIPCYGTTSGTFNVDCNNGDVIAVFMDPVPIIIEAGVALDGVVLTAEAAGLTYQWVDCNNGNEPIAGATGQSYEPVLSGSYAVVLTNGNCSVLSSCTEVIVTAIGENAGRSALVVSPNPFQDQLAVRTGMQAGTVRVQIFNADGRLVIEESRADVERITLQTAQLPSGSYVLRVLTDNTSRTIKVVK